MRKFLFAMLLGAWLAKTCGSSETVHARAARLDAPRARTPRARVAPARLAEPAWIKNPPHYDAAFLKVKPGPPPAWMQR